ncbi:MAG: acyclic terpene utilization AtuA family protein [Alphaproteobacteria bacterium]|nr:acyclic terpene utilization AtuA family protein [Alphaproteobacteria bacterium]
MLSTSGLLGYGFPEASLDAGMAREPHMIGVDGGSTDPGPYYLGSGKCVNSRMAMKRDLRLMLRAARKQRIPMVIGSCGGAGGEPHLQTVAAIVREIAREDGLHFRLALIHAEQDKAWVKEQLRKDRVKALRNVQPLDDKTIDRATRIVGMMGPEPFQRALDEGADVVLAGRSSDPAPWAGCATRAQLPPAPAWYAGKMLECGATAALPKGHDCLLTSVDRSGVVLEAMNPIRLCTPFSVANHSLHENSSPCFHIEPGGLLDTSDCTFEAVSDRAVRVSGMRWTQQPYTVKLEGAELVGYRAITICGTRDPLLISTIDDFLVSVRENVAVKAEAFGVTPDKYKLVIRTYGANGVMSAWEPVAQTQSHELGFVVEVIAENQEMANAVLAIARVQMLHVDFPGRLCKEGNMAFPYSPSDIETAPAYRFSVFHTVAIDDPCAPFPIEYETV